MLYDGYFDMSVYIYNRIKKTNMYAMLSGSGSKYAVLYKKAFPKREKAYDFWRDTFNSEILMDESEKFDEELSYEDSKAIVNWVYQVLRKSQERIEFTKELMKEIPEFQDMSGYVAFENGVLYNTQTVKLNFCDSMASVIKRVSSFNTDDRCIFFRGHSNANYMLQPSIMRSPKLYKNEDGLYNDLLVECPFDFENCHTHFEKLVKMQHYGLPTRLLDVTKNLLVALYFACESNVESYGELLVLTAKQSEIKYPQSDKVSILSSLPALSYEQKQQLLHLVKEYDVDKSKSDTISQRLLMEVQSEKPAFTSNINKLDLINNYIVYANKGNSRIIKQDGAFIICGLSTEKGALESFRFKNDKKIVILIKNKQNILKELESCSINHATLFPEIECVAEYLKRKYSRL